MSAIPERVLATHKSNLDALLAFQSAALSGMEKLIDLNVKVARASIDEAAARTHEVLSLKDAQQAVSFTANAAQPNSEKLVAYSKNLYDIVSGVHSEFSRLTEAQIAAHQQQVADAVEQWAKAAPAGSESAVAVVRSAVANATSAYDTLNKAARQATEVAESNIAAAATAGFEAAQTAGETARAASARVGKAASAVVKPENT